MALKFDDMKFKEILGDFSRIKEKSLPDSVILCAGLLCQELSRRTQPFGNQDKARDTGAGAVARDLVGLKGSVGLFAPIASAVQAMHKTSKDGVWVRLFVSKSGNIFVTPASNYQASASESDLDSLHKAHWSGGKIQNRPTATTSGRFTKLGSTFVPAATQHAYLQKVQKKVGIAKGAWADCAQKLRKVAKADPLKKFPEWVSRHVGMGLGDVSDRTSNTAEPMVELTSKCSYADDALRTSEQLQALSYTNSKLRRMLERILKKREQLEAAASAEGVQ